MTGEIPAELGSLPSLEVLDLRTNQLTGSIPAELGNLTNLVRLHLSSNQLTGTMPTTTARSRRKKEVIEAIKDYLFGEGDEAISKGDVIKLIKLYLFG